MRKVFGLLLGTLFVMCMGNACDDVKDATENLCGPCGEVSAGDDFISGDARLDGFFKAVGTLGAATAQVEVDLKEELLALGAVFDANVNAEMSIEDIASSVRAAIDAEISANVEGGIEVDFVPPKCQAAVDVAVDAQAHCEAQAGCDISAECESGEVSFSCKGNCTGGCEGTCEGGCSVEASGSCEGTCTGACQMDVAAVCEGICRGTCSGTCSLQNNAGECEGTCDGECQGSCELKAGGTCEGECHGECEVSVEAECEGECHGSCEGECSGGCEGEVTPPSCSAEGSCDASADCQASAKAQASASLECTPPTLTFRYDFAADVDADAGAEFVAKMAMLKVHMMGIVQGMFKMRALVDVNYAAELGIEPPVVAIAGQVEALLTADLDSFNIPPGRLVCVFPAFEEAFDIMTNLVTGLGGTFTAQVEIVGVLNVL